MASRSRWPVGALLACGIVVVASMTTWATFQGTLQSPFQASGPLAGLVPNLTMSTTVQVSGWNGTLTVADVPVPNWLVPAAAVFLAVMLALRAAGAWRPLGLVLLLPALYGSWHLVWFISVVKHSSEATLGIGAPIALGAFVLAGVLSMRSSARNLVAADGPVAPPTAREEPGAGGHDG